VSSVILCNDEFAQTAALDYWEMSAAVHLSVLESLRDVAEGTNLAVALADVRAAPADPRALAVLHRICVDRVGSQLREGGHGGWGVVVDRALTADHESRLWVETGEEYAGDSEPVAAADIPPPPVPGDRKEATVGVIVPFRDRSADQGRLRNLLACLHALGDQTLDRDAYRVITVEADARPRWAELLRERSDDYVFVPCPGHFNKGWAVNTGVVQAAQGCEILCILDADMLVDRDFLQRNVRRFAQRGAQAHWPFTDPLCLDSSATHAAIRQRCLKGETQPCGEQLRGVRLRRPPGHCVWLRAWLFHRLGGFDERFEGWGGEDLDFVFRLAALAALDRYPDMLLHMYHPRPQIKQDGERFYARRQLLTWCPTEPIGQLTGPAASALSGLAALIEEPSTTGITS